MIPGTAELSILKAMLAHEVSQWRTGKGFGYEMSQEVAIHPW